MQTNQTSPITPKKSGLRWRIDAMCRDCTYDPYDEGTWLKQVENYTISSCPLYDVRPKTRGRNTQDGGM